MKTVAAEARRLRKPLFIGEFGFDGTASAESDKAFEEVMRQVEALRPDMAAVWVFDYPDQEKDGWNITPTNSHAARLKLIAEANRRAAQAANQ